MPSPGSTATFTLVVPGELRPPPVLESADLVRVAQRQADLIEPVEEAVLAERIHVEAELLRAVGRRDHLLFEVDGQLERRERRGVVEELVHLRLGEDDGQKTVLERVA